MCLHFCTATKQKERREAVLALQFLPHQSHKACMRLIPTLTRFRCIIYRGPMAPVFAVCAADYTYMLSTAKRTLPATCISFLNSIHPFLLKVTIAIYIYSAKTEHTHLLFRILFLTFNNTLYQWIKVT